MDKQIFRSGTTQVQRALFNTIMLKWMVFECIMFSGIVGFWEHSWAMFLATFLLCLSCLVNPLVRKACGIFFTILWGIGAGYLGGLSGEPLAIVMGVVFGCLFGYVIHQSAFQWQDDFR